MEGVPVGGFDSIVQETEVIIIAFLAGLAIGWYLRSRRIPKPYIPVSEVTRIAPWTNATIKKEIYG